MPVADSYKIQIHITKPRILLTLFKAETNISGIIFDKDEAERLIAKLQDAITKMEAPPRRRKHLWGNKGKRRV